MKQLNILLLVAMLLASCTAIKGIFKAGAWSGAILVIVVIALIIFVVSKIVKKD
jgi:cytosine/uracil/thiamine/allantoin permease